MSKPTPLQYGQYYHIYNRGNNREDIFIQERNYRYFLKLYAKHIEPMADTYAYCLLRNHFHFLVRIKDLDEDLTEDQDLTGFENLSGLGRKPSQAFSNLFNAYARAFNRAFQRTGALFQRPFGRKQVDSDRYFVQLVTYIHQNPQKHGFIDDFRAWPYSSYHAHVSNKSTRLKRDDVLSWFDGVEAFKQAHQRAITDSMMAPLVMEDFE
jgi:REP element-mobilizing transposase RayT